MVAGKWIFEILVIACLLYSSKPPDSDGLVISFKHVLDALILADVIIDDNYMVIGMPDYKWQKQTRGKGYIEFEVFEESQVKA